MLTADVEGHPEVAGPLSPLQLGRASLTYAVGGLAYKGIALLSVPILARLLAPAELGLLDLAAVLASLVALTVSVGTDQSIAYLEPRTTNPARLWGSALALVSVGGLVAVLVVILIQGPVASVLTGSQANGVTIVAAAVYGGVMALSAFSLVTIRLRATARIYAVASFLIITAEMTGALLVAWLLADPVTIMVLAWAAGAAAVSLPLLARYLPRLGRPSGEALRRLATYGVPLIPATMAWLVGDAWIRSALARDAELATLGEYGIAFRIASVLGLVVTGFGVAWYPYMYRTRADQVHQRAATTLTVVVAVLGAGAVILTALSPEVIAIVAGARYAGARHAVAGLAGGTVAMGAFVLAGGVIGTSGSTRRVAVTAISGMLVQFALALALIRPMGLAGAALASLAGYLIAAIAALLMERRLLNHDGLTLGVTMVAGAVGLIIAHALVDQGLPIRLVVASLAITSIVVVGVRARRWTAEAGT